MKKLYFLLLLIIPYCTSFAQDFSKSYVNPILREYYDADVKDACLQWVM